MDLDDIIEQMLKITIFVITAAMMVGVVGAAAVGIFCLLAVAWDFLRNSTAFVTMSMVFCLVAVGSGAVWLFKNWRQW